MNNDFNLYGVLNTETGKLVSDITNPRHKYWDKKDLQNLHYLHINIDLVSMEKVENISIMQMHLK